MELADSNKSLQRTIAQKNSEVKKIFKKGEVVNGCLLKLDTAFGINSNPICNQLQIVGDKYVVFMIGSIIVVRDIVDKNESFYSYPNRFTNVSALYAVSKQQKFKQKSKILDSTGKPVYLPGSLPIKIYLAESSQNQDKTANIIFIKPYKNKLRIMNTGVKGTVKEITVDRQKKMCGCLVQSIQNTYVILFNYRKERLLTCTSLSSKMSSLSIENISIHPTKQKSVVLMGKNYLRLWQLHSQQGILKEQQQLVSLKTEKQNKFYDFSWQNGSKNPIFFVLTSGNKILLIQNENLVKNIELTQKEQLFSITATKKGFCVGGANKALSIYELDKNMNHSLVLGSGGKPLNQQSQNSHEDSQDRIVRIHSSSNDGFFTIATTNQIGSFNFYYLNTFRIDADISSLDQFFPSGFHNKKVNCLSTSVTKQLLASCSEDNTVKIWNFFDAEGYEKKGLISHCFSEEPLSVSMHPSGLFLAVSFSSGFKVFAIVNDTLQVLKDIQIPNCKLIKYSHGGHFLAVNEKEHIFIYDSIYYETLHLFSLTNYVQDLTISYDDTHIIATCTSGYVYCFNLYDSIHNKDYHSKKGYEHKQSTPYNCICYDNKITLTDKNDKVVETDLFLGCTSEKYMVIYKNRCKDLVAEFPIVDCHVTSILICPIQGVVFMGTSKGTLRMYLWPLDESSLEWQNYGESQTQRVRFKQPEFVEMNAHSYPLVSITASHDQSYLFTGSQDGTILCFSMCSKKQKQKKEGYHLVKPQDRKRIAQSANDLYLQRVDKIEEKNDTIKKLKFEILRSEKKLKLEKEKLEIIYRQKIETLRKQYKITLETNKKIKQSYIQNSTKQYQELSEKLQSQKKAYADQLDKLKQSHKQKIEYQLKRNQTLKTEIQALHQKHGSELVQLKDTHQKSMKNTKFDFYDKCHKLQIKYSNFLNESKKNSQQFSEQLNKKQKEYEEEIQKEIRAKKEEIAKVKTINQQLQQKNRKLTTEFNRLKQEDEKQQEHFEQLFKQHNDIRFENLKSDQQILKMQHQLLERLQVIESKEETCRNARYQQTTLENFRYMLDSKIQTLQEKKQDMIKKIKSRQTDLKNMFNELIKESEENQKKAFELKQLNVQIQVLEKEIKKAEQQIDSNQNKLKFFKSQVSSIANSNEEVQSIGKKLKNLIDECQNSSQKPMQQENGDNADSTKEVNEQLGRQAKWMQKKLKMVKDISQNYKQMREQNINNVLAQNTKLIEQCNKLRTLNEQFKRNIKQYQKELADLVRKKEKNSLLKKQQEAVNLKGINKKLQENQARINDQHKNLQSISEQVKEILRYKSQSKFPHVAKRKL